MSAWHHNNLDAQCDCEQCKLTDVITSYMMWHMPRSDRALWPVPAPRLSVTEPPAISTPR